MAQIATVPRNRWLRTWVALAVRAGRREAGLSQRELAEAAALSKSAIARIEAETGNPTLDAVEAALAAVGLGLAVVRPAEGMWNPAREAIDGDLEWACDRAGRQLPAHLREERVYYEEPWRGIRRMLRGGPMLSCDQPWTYRMDSRRVVPDPGPTSASASRTAQRPEDGPGVPSSRRRR